MLVSVAVTRGTHDHAPLPAGGGTAGWGDHAPPERRGGMLGCGDQDNYGPANPTRETMFPPSSVPVISIQLAGLVLPS